MLSVVAQVFDPLEMLCPALLIPKLLVQEAWAVKSSWDADLPPAIKSRFLKWLNDLHVLENIQITRYSKVFNAISREVHVFVDSSQDSMAAVAFMRTEMNGEVAVLFLLAKSRLTPVKKQTIPRSELVSCVVSVRIASVVRNALEVDPEQFIFWSDSSTALAWIKRAGDWGVFVRNRVGEILQHTTPDQWRHVPGERNPADLPSRGSSPIKLVLSKWWEGPLWLRGPKDSFPKSCPVVDELVVSTESKKVSVMMTIPVESTPRFSSYRKNVAVMGWVLRFLDVCVYKKYNIKEKFLTIRELRNAEKFVLKKIQRESFPSDCKEIGGMMVTRDSDGVLRIKTRLGNRSDHADFIYPIVLPKSHPLVDMLVRDVHLYHGHGGVQFLASKIREKYWILQSRRVIRRLVRGCIQCRRYSGKRLEVDPAALPPKRVEDCEAFTTTGVYLAGPLFLRNGEKAWIVLYTCAVFRAVYLDVVTSLSTEAFLGSLERFVSQYGHPNTIYSDNGTNFVGAVNIFKQIDWNEVEKESHVKQIQWIFNPPTGAWWGGFWERLVRSVKDLLRRMLGRSKLTYDELRTCIAGISATINDRPLTLVTEDNQDLTPLTPAMFIRPRGCGHVPELDFASSLKKSYAAMKERQARLQHRFRKEYLSLLVTRVGKKQQSVLQLGDVVLVGADNKKRFEWPLGLVMEMFPGKDGKSRVAKVKVSGGMLIRPIQRLYPLEISQQGEVDKKSVTCEPNDNVEHVTRIGKQVKKPVRYGQWLHLTKTWTG